MATWLNTTRIQYLFRCGVKTVFDITRLMQPTQEAARLIGEVGR
ncbi:MAG: hypothetical protein ACYSR9_11970 [Planctomycetota bacterium]